MVPLASQAILLLFYRRMPQPMGLALTKMKADKLAALKKEYLVEEDSIDDFWDNRPSSGAPEADDEPGIPTRELAKR